MLPPLQARGTLQNRVLLWKEQSEASRNPSRAHSPALLGPVLGPAYPSGRLTPTRLDMVRPWAAPPLFPPPLVPPPLFAPPLFPPPLFAPPLMPPPLSPAPSVGPWGLWPSRRGLLPPRVPLYAEPPSWPLRPGAASAPPWWLGPRALNPYADYWDWGWGLD